MLFLNDLIEKLKNNKKVIENYFFMSISLFSGSLFGLIMYPYLIRILGSGQYGFYVFWASVFIYINTVIKFGFDLIAVNCISECRESVDEVSGVVSSIVMAKFYIFLLLSILTLLVFASLDLGVDIKICVVFLIGSFATVLNTSWYFQIMQKMKLATVFALVTKLISIPFIFIFVQSSDDVLNYIVILGLTELVFCVCCFLYLIYWDGINFKTTSFLDSWLWYKKSFSLFLTGIISAGKQYGSVVIIGGFYGLHEVALYDLANKIVSIPRMFFNSINGALFPKISQNFRSEIVVKVIKYEVFLAAVTILFMTAFSSYIIKFLGGDEMVDAYGLVIALSFTILAWLVVGAIIHFVFLPNNKTHLIAVDQAIAAISFFAFSALGVLISDKIIVFCAAMSLSGIVELIYCFYVSRRHRLL